MKRSLGRSFCEHKMVHRCSQFRTASERAWIQPSVCSVREPFSVSLDAHAYLDCHIMRQDTSRGRGSALQYSTPRMMSAEPRHGASVLAKGGPHTVLGNRAPTHSKTTSLCLSEYLMSFTMSQGYPFWALLLWPPSPLIHLIIPYPSVISDSIAKYSQRCLYPSDMMGDDIEVSPSPELEPNVIYRPSHCKRDPLTLPDGHESAIKLTDPTVDHSSAPYERIKRRTEAVDRNAEISTPSNVPVALPRAFRCGSMPRTRFSLH
jgi:hypothetical protein